MLNDCCSRDQQSQANLASAQLRLTEATLTAPFDGVVADLPVSVGQQVSANATAVNPSKPGANDGLPRFANLRIPCTVVGANVPANGVTYSGAAIDGCPNHLGSVNGQKFVSFDVAAWADLWFYSNPIYIEVKGSTKVAGVK